MSISTTTFGSTVHYSCFEGYIFEGDETRVCLSDGEWSESQPTCTSESTSRYTYIHTVEPPF